MADDAPDPAGRGQGSGILSNAGATRLIEDVNLLLDYAGRSGNARFDACFDDTRGNMPMPVDFPAPPEKTKQALAAALTRIARAADAGHPPEPEEVALLLRTRDLLARAVAPATVDTIRLTAAFERARAAPNPVSRLLLAAGRLLRRGPGPRRGAVPAGQRTVDRLGTQLASSVLVIQLVCALTVLATVGVSTLVLTGKLVLEQRTRVTTEYAAVARDISVAQKEEMRGPAVPLNLNLLDLPVARMRHYCDFIARDPDGRLQFHSQRQSELCPVFWGTNQRMNDADLHLALWNSVFTDGWSGSLLGFVFGVPAQGIQTVAGRAARLDGGCDGYPTAPRVIPIDAPMPRAVLAAADGDPCAAQYRTALVRSVLVAEAVIGGISQYVLPCLYALLGAFAAVLRGISARADAAQLSRSERSRAVQSLLLGLLFGAVIGLFTTMLGSAGEANVALSVNAVALLAGYSVGGVFGFFDQIVTRLFGQPA